MIEDQIISVIGGVVVGSGGMLVAWSVKKWFESKSMKRSKGVEAYDRLVGGDDWVNEGVIEVLEQHEEDIEIIQERMEEIRDKQEELERRLNKLVQSCRERKDDK